MSKFCQVSEKSGQAISSDLLKFCECWNIARTIGSDLSVRHFEIAFRWPRWSVNTAHIVNKAKIELVNPRMFAYMYFKGNLDAIDSIKLLRVLHWFKSTLI